MIYWFLAGIILLGLITSFEDVKYGKIRNKWITLSVVYCVLAYVAIISYYRLNHLPIRAGYFWELGLTAFFSLLIGLVIWIAGFWTPGDAKLFFAYSLLVPLDVYKYGYVPYFSSTNILVNTFVPAFIFLALMLFFKTSLKQKIFYLKKSFELRKIFEVFVYLFAFGWIAQIGFSFLHIQINPFLMLVVLFLLVLVFESLFPAKTFYVILLVALLRLFVDKSVYSLASIEFILIIWLLFIVMRFFILYLGYNILTKGVDIKLLQPGMIAAELVYLDKGKYKKEELIFFSLVGQLRKKGRKYLFEASSEGLSREDVGRLKKLKLDFEHLRVQQTLSFAPFLFAGALMAIIFHGNFLYSILSML